MSLTHKTATTLNAQSLRSSTQLSKGSEIKVSTKATAGSYSIDPPGENAFGQMSCDVSSGLPDR